MKKLLLTISMVLFSFIVSAKETWLVKEMPEVAYLFKTVVGDSSSSSKAIAAVKELVELAKKHEVVFSKTAFFKIDFKSKSSSEIGLEVKGPNLTKIPAENLKTRPAGKYLLGHYIGKQTRLIYKSVGPQLKKNKVTPKEPGAYVYSKNAGTDNASMIVLIPLM